MDWCFHGKQRIFFGFCHLIFFYWSLIALQFCVSFCCTTTWISICIQILPPPPHPSTPPPRLEPSLHTTPLRHQRALILAPCAVYGREAENLDLTSCFILQKLFHWDLMDKQQQLCKRCFFQNVIWGPPASETLGVDEKCRLLKNLLTYLFGWSESQLQHEGSLVKASKLLAMACWIELPDQGSNLGPPALRAWSFGHWTTRAVPRLFFFFF